jgi:hypothetical protein
MRSFLLKNNKPIISWGSLPDGTLFKGEIPEGYDLAVNPHQPYIIVDVDRHDKDGFLNIPEHLKSELESTLNYPTKNNGRHYWFYYTGDKTLINKASNLGIDLRIGNEKYSETKWVNGGYVKWHPRNEYRIEDVLWQAKETSLKMNKWLEELFSYKKKKII